MAKHDQLHIRIDPGLHENFYFWCRRHGRTMTEVCLLLFDAVLNGSIDLDELKQGDTDDRDN